MLENLFRKSLTGAVIVMFTLGVPQLANSQDDDRTWLQVRTTYVKTDRVGDYEELLLRYFPMSLY